MRPGVVITATMLLLAVTPYAQADNIENLIEKIQAIGPEGKNHAAAVIALRNLQSQPAEALLPIAKAMGSGNKLADNWLRNAFEVIADRVLSAKKPLPAKQLIGFIKTTTNNAGARRLVFEWAVKQEKTLADNLIPGMLRDPSPEFRRDAVARLLESAEKNLKAEENTKAKAALKKALTGAVHDDQVRKIAGHLKKLGETVDIRAHYGFLNTWEIVGPFDNKKGVGFAAVYPPEKDPGEYDTKTKFATNFFGEAKDVGWNHVESKDDYGIVNIAKSLTNWKGSAVYSATTFHSKVERDVQFRLGTPNAWKIWLNGKLLFAREEYHRSTRMDQYIVEATLKPGANVILVKLCQNEQEQPWAQKYQLQFRVTDETGTAIPDASK